MSVEDPNGHCSESPQLHPAGEEAKQKSHSSVHERPAATHVHIQEIKSFFFFFYNHIFEIDICVVCF